MRASRYNSREVFVLRKGMFMKRNTIMISTLLIWMLACAIPAAGSQPASSTATFDSAPLNTMVAETVSAALTLTAQAMPTFTNTPTLTPAPSVVEEVRSSLTLQPDSSTLFVDELAGYSVLLPPGWLPARINQQEYLDAFSLPEVLANERYQQALLSIQDQNPAQMRLFLMDLLPEHLQKDVVTNIVFLWDDSSSISLDTDEGLQALAGQIESANPNAAISSVSIVILPGGMIIGVIESAVQFQSGSGETDMLYQRQVVFPSGGGTQSIVLTTLQTLKDEILPAFNAMLDTISTEAG